MEKIISISNLSIAFNKYSDVVKNVNIDVVKGKTTAIVGESGSGKTLSALSILKLLPNGANIKTGEITYNNKNLLNLSKKEIQNIRGNKISTIFQEPMTSLNPLHTINKQIEEIITTHNALTKKEAKKRNIKLLNEVGLSDISSRPKIYPYELSGGQRQRAMIAMALSNDPKVLIADEPTTSLDVSVENKILHLLEDLKKSFGMSILFITHDLNVVKRMADKVVVMQSGKIIETGLTKNIINNPKMDYTRKLFSEPEKIIKKKKTTNYPLVEVKNIIVDYPIRTSIFSRSKKKYRAVNEVNFRIAPGETLGIVGESGSGKSSLALGILRLIHSEGDILLEKKSIRNLRGNNLTEIRKDIQIVFQDPYGSLSPRMCISEIISEGLNEHYPNLSKSEVMEKVKESIENVELPNDILTRYPHEFSGGQRQRIAIARAIILKPKFLILDEPTSALDRTIQLQILRLLNKLQNKYNMAYLFISHNLRLMKFFADRLLVMNKGSIVEEGSTLEIFKKPRSKYSKLLFEAAFNKNYN